jgi:hypothetical protein
MLLRYAFYAILVIGFLWSVIPTLRAHGKEAHKRARYKCFFIWLVSTLPVLFSLAGAPRSSLSWSYAMEMSGSPFSMSEQLVYTSTFLSPVLFVFIEAIISFFEESDEGRVRRFKHVMKSYHKILLPALILMMVSVSIYSGIKTDAAKFRETVWFDLFGNKAILLYLASLIYWYCVLVIEGAPEEDYAAITEIQKRDFTAAARDRIGGAE